MENRFQKSLEILEILEEYEFRLITMGTKPKKIFFRKYFLKIELNKNDILKHVYYLILETKKYKKDEYYFAKLNQTLGAVQAFLLMTGEISILDSLYSNKKIKISKN